VGRNDSSSTPQCALASTLRQKGARAFLSHPSAEAHVSKGSLATRLAWYRYSGDNPPRRSRNCSKRFLLGCEILRNSTPNRRRADHRTAANSISTGFD
jgi:hypothetical protein